MKRCIFYIVVFLLFLAVVSCKSRTKTKQEPLYIDLIKETSKDKDSVVFHDNFSGKDMKIKVLTEEELEQKHKEFNDKYPDML